MNSVSSKIEDILISPPSDSAIRKVQEVLRPRNVGYVALRSQSNDLVLHQALLDKVIKGNSSYFFQVYYSTKGFLNECFFNIKQLSIEELFDLQLENVSSLNYNLRSITNSSRRELNFLRSYYDERHSELRECISITPSSASEISSKADEYNLLNKQLKDFKTKDSDYFDCEFKLRKLKRELSDDVHKYGIVNESVLDLSKETEFLTSIEDLLLSSVQLSETIAVKAKRIERHIGATKRAYSLLCDQQEAAAVLDNSMNILTKFTLGMHQVLASGLEDMSEVIGSGSSLESFYSSALKGLGGFVSSVTEANLSRNADVEATVQKYLCNSY